MHQFAERHSVPQVNNSIRLSRSAGVLALKSGIGDGAFPAAARHDLSEIPARGRDAQVKLTIGRTDDAHEQEADHVAGQVMGMSGTQAKCGCNAGCSKCATAQSAPVQLQTKAAEGQANHSAAPPIVHQVLSSAGRSLDTETRAFMEPRFGRDFSGVRVHADSQAFESARAVNALAYTVGRDIVFNAGRYAPSTNEGRSLLAHELTHVAQQAGQSPAEGRLQRVADKPASHEMAQEGVSKCPPKRPKPCTICWLPSSGVSWVNDNDNMGARPYISVGSIKNANDPKFDPDRPEQSIQGHSSANLAQQTVDADAGCRSLAPPRTGAMNEWNKKHPKKN